MGAFGNAMKIIRTLTEKKISPTIKLKYAINERKCYSKMAVVKNENINKQA